MHQVTNIYVLSFEYLLRFSIIIPLFGKDENKKFINSVLSQSAVPVRSSSVLRQMRKMRSCVLTGFLLSCGIEISQLITQRGYCQLDDVVTNTAGTLIGWTIWKGFGKIITIKKTNEESIKK